MLSKTQAIVLNQFKYNDSSVIVQLYTRDYGRMSVMLKGVGSKKGRTKLVLFSPISLLDIEINYKAKRQIQSIKNFSPNPVYTEIPYKTSKSTIALFLAEVFSKSLREEEANFPLFDFLKANLIALDNIENGLGNFHLHLLIKMSRYLGFYPNNNYSQTNAYFDLHEGKYTIYNSISPYLLDKDESNIIYNLQKLDITTLNKFNLNRKIRTILIDKLIIYYQLHLEGFGELNSLKILNEIFE